MNIFNLPLHTATFKERPDGWVAPIHELISREWESNPMTRGREHDEQHAADDPDPDRQCREDLLRLVRRSRVKAANHIPVEQRHRRKDQHRHEPVQKIYEPQAVPVQIMHGIDFYGQDSEEYIYVNDYSFTNQKKEIAQLRWVIILYSQNFFPKIFFVSFPCKMIFSTTSCDIVSKTEHFSVLGQRNELTMSQFFTVFWSTEHFPSKLKLNNYSCFTLQSRDAWIYSATYSNPI